MESRGFCGNYILDGNDICFRTQVAVRILVLPVRKWERFVDGVDDAEREQGAVDKILLKVLRKFKIDVEVKIAAVEALNESVGTTGQRDTLGRRWKQIQELVLGEINRIQT